jgi:hypothetical protein
VLQALPDIIAMTERIMSASDGPTKKLFAMGVGQLVAQTIQGASGGGQAETWAKISALMGAMIDHSISVINQAKPIVKKPN